MERLSSFESPCFRFGSSIRISSGGPGSASALTSRRLRLQIVRPVPASKNTPTVGAHVLVLDGDERTCENSRRVTRVTCGHWQERTARNAPKKVVGERIGVAMFGQSRTLKGAAEEATTAGSNVCGVFVASYAIFRLLSNLTRLCTPLVAPLDEIMTLSGH